MTTMPTRNTRSTTKITTMANSTAMGTSTTKPTGTAIGTRATMRRLPYPATEPPYDDQIAFRPDRQTDHPPTQGALALAFTLPTGAPAEPEPPATLRLLQTSGTEQPPDSEAAGIQAAERDHTIDAFVARRPTGADRLPEPRRWAARLAQAIVEALHGHRPVQQLLRWTNDEVYAAIANRLASRRRVESRLRPVIQSLRVCTPTDGVAEASIVVQIGQRYRAMAMRLEGLDGRWRCTAFELI